MGKMDFSEKLFFKTASIFTQRYQKILQILDFLEYDYLIAHSNFFTTDA